MRQTSHENNGSCSFSLLPKLHNLIFPHMSLEPLELPPLHWIPSECLQVSEFVCRPFKRMTRFPATLCLTWSDEQSSHCFSLTDVGTFLTDTGPLGWRAWCGTGAPPSLEGISITEVFLLVFNHNLWFWGQPI